jgi:hypothetical protein
MTDRFRELWEPDAKENLEFFHKEALELARVLRARRDEHGRLDENQLKHDMRTFFNRIREKEDLIGVVRATRLLRHGAMPVFGIDLSARIPNLETAIAWLDKVVENIEHELDVIDRKRILWLTAGAAVGAAIAAIFGFFTLVLDLFKSFIAR